MPFPQFYVKIENGFVAQENCFVARARTKQNQKSNDFNCLYRPPNRFGHSLGDGRPDSSAKAVEFDEPNLASADCPEGAQLLLNCTSRPGEPVVGNGNFDPGKQAMIRHPPGTTIRRATRSGRFAETQIDGTTPAKASTGEICGAMLEQHGHGDRSGESAPQKFVQLVGCRDANARARAAMRPRPVHRKP